MAEQKEKYLFENINEMQLKHLLRMCLSSILSDKCIHAFIHLYLLIFALTLMQYKMTLVNEFILKHEEVNMSSIHLGYNRLNEHLLHLNVTLFLDTFL